MDDARWVTGVGYKPIAHLLRPNGGAIADQRSWCDAAANNHEPAPYLPRCGSCVAALRRYQNLAVQPVPKRVTTVLLVTIEHGNDETRDEVMRTAVRRMAPGRSPRWSVTAEIGTSVPVEPETP